MKNPLLDEFNTLDKNPLNMLEARWNLCREYAFAIPTKEAIQAIVKYSPLVEIGAGSGYWAWMIEQMGGDTVCYDNKQHTGPNGLWLYSPDIIDTVYYPIKYNCNKDDPDPLQVHSDRTLMLCWPDYLNPMAYEYLSRYTGKHFIYIGEGPGYSCADDDFFHLLESDFKQIKQISIPRYWGVYDDLQIYERV